MDGAKYCVIPLSILLLFWKILSYRSLVGALQHLTWTKPNLSFFVNLVYQFMCSPRQSHFQIVKIILRYLRGSIDLGLWFSKCSTTPCIKAFSDADWVDCSIDKSPPEASAYFWEIPQSIEVLKINQQWQEHQQKPNIAHWPTLVQKSHGFVSCWWILASNFHILFNYGVTIYHQFLLLKFLSFMVEPNMWKLITITQKGFSQRSLNSFCLYTRLDY